MNILLAPLLIAHMTLQQTTAGAPRFSEFAVPRERAAHTVHLQLTDPTDPTDPKSREYATRLRESAHQPPNFAGHFVLASWGCGASCVMTAAIDVGRGAQAGQVVWLPFTVCCWDVDVSKPLDFRVDSRLLVVHGSRNEHGGGTYDYTFDGKAFKLIQAQEKR